MKAKNPSNFKKRTKSKNKKELNRMLRNKIESKKKNKNKRRIKITIKRISILFNIKTKQHQLKRNET